MLSILRIVKCDVHARESTKVAVKPGPPLQDSINELIIL